MEDEVEVAVESTSGHGDGTNPYEINLLSLSIPISVLLMGLAQQIFTLPQKDKHNQFSIR